MRFFTSIIALLLLSVSALSLHIDTADLAARTTTTAKVCDPKAKGSDLAQKQYDALADFAYLFGVKQDALAAFNKYVPGQYIQHNPFSQQGRAFAIQYLSTSFATGQIKNTNMTLWSGQGFGAMHYKMATPGITFAVVDMFRFQGTCIVEHWDVLQQITGTETNPIAFF